MKLKKTFIPLVLPLLILTSCNDKDSFKYEGVISDIRVAEVGTTHTVSGVVVKHVYTGQSIPYITGFMLANESGCIYVWGETVAKTVKVGEKVKVEGKKTYYVPQTDEGAAAASGYKGQLQLTNPVLIENIGGEHDIPSKAITSIDNINEVTRHAVNDDISNNIYRAIGRVTKTIGGDYTNYYLYDRNREDAISFYTQSNGKDYAWLEPYVDKYVDMTFIAINAKPGNALWRGLPVLVNDDSITISNEDEAKYAAERALKTLLDSYSDETKVSVKNTDELLEGVKLSYSSKSELVSISETTDGFDINFKKPSTETEVEVEITASYKGASSKVIKKIKLGVEVKHQAISISEALSKETGTEVIIEGILSRKTYKRGTDDPLGGFIIDSTGSIVVYNDAPYMASLANATEGNKVMLKGTIDRYISTNTAESGYTGDVQLRNTELLFVDGANNPIPSEAIEEKTVEWIQSQPATNNISSKVFKVTAKIIKSTGYATSYSLKDPNNLDKSLSVYSQRSGSDFSWLDPYADQVVTLYVGVQNLQLRSGSPNWRCCPIQIISAN